MAKNEKELEIKVEGKEWEEAIEKAFKEENAKAKIDGFRPGKAPKEVFIKKYGEQNLLYKAADMVAPKAYDKMLEECKDELDDLVARPEIEFKDMSEKGITFKFILTMRPTVKLGKYKGLDVKKDEPSVTAEEIENAIDNMRQRFAEDVLKDGKIENGDIAVIDFEGFIDGKPFDGGKGENYSLTIGSGTFIPGFEEQLIGLEPGDEKDVGVTFPKDYHAKELKGKKATFKVMVHEIKEVKVPELDKDFFEDLGMEGINTKEELEAEISENILSHKEAQAEDKYLDTLLEEAAKNVEVEIPEVMIDEELDRMIKQYDDHLKSQDISLEQFYKFTGSDEDALKSQMRPEAIKRITYRLMLEEIAKEEKIEISDEDAKKEAKELADKYQMKEEEFLQIFGGLDIVKYDLKMRRAMDILKK